MAYEENSSEGWVKLYRSILNHWVFDDPIALKMWIWFLLSANYKSREIAIGNSVEEIEKGQRWTSIRKLSEELKIAPMTVIAKLKMLENSKMICVESRRGKGTRVTVCNYQEYQDVLPSRTQASTQASTQSRTQASTQTRYKQERKEREKKKEGGTEPRTPVFDPEHPDYSLLPPDHPNYFVDV